ncbi:MAG TPA: MarC family protein, partial [Gammaproteobacteria bacterium]|nr:MarC family protein [Gammaproteobacteria bacterium]
MNSLLNIFLALFVVVDPIGLAPMFMALTRGLSVQLRRRIAIKGTVLAAAILLVFFFTGDVLLKALGVSLAAFRIAGGALLFLLAIDMVFARQSGLRSTTQEEQQEAEHRQDVSVFPLAFPLIAGPGAMTTVILVGTVQHDPVLFLGALLSLAVILALTLASLLSASRLLGILGETGTNVVSRVFGVVLAALAVQFILDGAKAWFMA